ncbi:MAG: restriction endonuclease subunit S [Desulfamplus sp.]|nr:restriction endonuclease subunit S [Desulfamplus sp.]
MSTFVKNLVTELPKSPLPAGYATEGDEFTFFVSGPKPLECDKYIVDGEAIVFSTGGNAAVHYGKGKFSYSTDCWALQPVENDIEGKYLYYFLSSQISRIDALGFEGSDLKHLRKDFVRNYKVPDLSKPEQSKIAEVLSKVDQAIEQTESLIAKQQHIKSGLMQDLLTRGIDEHGNLRSEETHEFKDSPLGRIPVEWEVDKLENVSDFITSGSRGWARYYSEEGAIFIRIGNLTREHIHMRFDDVVYVNPPLTSEGKRTAVNAGDLLISITADLGIIAVIPDEFPEAYVNQHIALVRLNKSKIVPCFAGWFLAGYRGQSQFDKLNESGAKAGLNLPTVKNLLVPRLDISEQEQIVKTLGTNIYSLNGHQSQLSKLRSLKTALMQDLLTGKVRVTPLMENTEVCT